MIEAEDPVSETANDTVNGEALDALRSVLGLEFSALVRDFNKQMANGLVRLELAIAQGDAARISTIAHTLKGSALSLHCRKLADCCARVERNARQLAGSGEGDAQLDELKRCIRVTIDAIDDWAARGK